MTMPLIGRNRELEAVSERLKAARAGRGGVVFLRGEAGVGKSRLLDEAGSMASLLGFRTLSGRADELQRRVPYAALREALGPAIATEQNEMLAAVAQRAAAALLLREDGPAESEPTGGAGAAVDDLLSAWADRQPVLLILDDLHAADDDTVSVLSLLGRTLASTRALVISALRADPPDMRLELAAMLERLGSSPSATVIDVAPLDDDDVRSLLSSVLGAPPEDELVRSALDQTRGNPFYVKELLGAYDSAGLLDRSGGSIRLLRHAAETPITRRSAVLHRVFSLGHAAREVARVLSAYQRIDIDRLDTVASLAGVSEAEVSEAFDTLVRARVLARVDEQSFEFVHPILRATLANDLGPTERRRIHRGIADALIAERAAGRPVSVLEIAAYITNAGPSGEADAETLLAAGDAAASSAPHSAADWYAAALRCLPDHHPSKAAVLGRRARVLFLALRKEEAVAAGRQALDLLGDDREADRVAAVTLASLSSLGRMDEALELADSLLTRGAGDEPRLLAQRAQLLVHLDRFDEAAKTAKAALQKARRPEDRIPAFSSLAAMESARGRPEDAIARLDEGRALATHMSTGLRLGLATARTTYLATSGFPREAEQALDEALGLAASLGGDAFRTNLEPAAVWIDALLGRWDSAVSRADVVGAELERTGELFVAPIARVMQVWILAARGQLRDARRALDSVPRVVTSRSSVKWAAATLEVAAGDLDSARERLIAAWEIDRRVGRFVTGPLLLSRLVEIAVEQQDGTARKWFAELDELGPARATPWATVLFLRCRAAAFDDADAAAEAALRADEAGLCFEGAVARLLRATIDGSSSEDAALAHEEFMRLEAVPWRRRAATVLRGLGARVPRVRDRNTGLLTDTEVKLAELVRDGLSNKEIAAVLFLSAKTVEAYLSRVYAKTGCSSRVDLAVAVDSGLLSRMRGD